MKRSITRWTVALAAAGVLGLPVSSLARTQDPAPQQPQQQQPQPQPDRPQQPPSDPRPSPQPTQPQPTQSPTAATTPASADQAATPQEHLQQAQSAVNSIEASSVPAKNRANLADLKKHLSNLEKLGSTPAATSTEPGKAGASKTNWGTEVAAIDKIISEIVNGESSTTPTPTGTSGTTAKSSTMIDEATRAKLMDVRTHITAYAAGMAGTSTPKTEASAAAAATAAGPEPSMTSSAPSSTPSSSPSSAAAPSQNPASTSSQTPQSTPSQTPQSTPPQNPQPDPNAPTQQPPTAAQPPAAGAAQVDAEAAHRHLVTARDALSQMTQLPAAGQLSGEARTQVAQLITNFNELIGNPPDWHASYQKVAANLNTLLGPENSDAEANAGAPTTATGATAAPGAPAPGATPTPNATTPGAVGTAGTGATVELDPTIRAKLVEFRKSLNDFQKAAGGTK
jgi:hypothetical protein